MTQVRHVKARKTSRPTAAEYALALAAYRDGQERMKYLLQKTLGKYGRPKLSLKELRKQLQEELGDISLSQEIIKMRQEGF